MKRSTRRPILLLAVSLCALYLPTMAAAAQRAGDAHGGPLITLIDEEQAWLTQHPVLRFAAAAEQPPAVMLTPQGELVGMIPDLFSRLSTLIGQRLELVPARNAAEAHARARAPGNYGKAAVIETPGNRKPYLLTRPYYATPLLIIVRAADRSRYRSEQGLAGHRVAIPADHRALSNYLHETLSATPYLVTTPREQLLAVSNGDADAALGYSTYRYLLSHHFMVDLAIAFETSGQLDVCIGVNAEYPTLARDSGQGDRSARAGHHEPAGEKMDGPRP